MFMPLTLEQYQRDIDDGWKEYCDDKIHHWRKLQIRCTTEDGKSMCQCQIEHFKRMRRRR